MFSLPKAVWVNSKTYLMKKDELSLRPCIVDDSMPDGIHNEPNEATIKMMIRRAESDCEMAWYDKNKDSDLVEKL